MLSFPSFFHSHFIGASGFIGRRKELPSKTHAKRYLRPTEAVYTVLRQVVQSPSISGRKVHEPYEGTPQ